MTFSKKDLLQQSWAIYKTHAISLSFIYSVIFAVLWVSNRINKLVFLEAHEYKYFIFFVNLFIQSFVGLAIIYMVIKIDKNRAPKMSDFFKKIDRYFSFLALLIVYIILLYAGLFFFIVPGLLVLTIFTFALYAFVDKDLGIFESLKYSWQITRGHRLNIFLFILILFTMNILSALSFVGLLLTLPLTNIATARLYLLLSCLDENKLNQDYCGVSLNSLSLYQKIFAFLILFSLFIWGLFVFSKNVGFLSGSLAGDTSVQEWSKNINGMQDMSKLEMALEIYKDENGSYPDNIEQLKVFGFSDLNMDNVFYKKEMNGYVLCDKYNNCVHKP